MAAETEASATEGESEVGSDIVNESRIVNANREQEEYE